MCHLRGGPYCEPCCCDDYRGAVRKAVHAKAVREHSKSNRIAREEQEVYDHDESASLRAQGYTDTTNEPDDGEEHLYAAGREWTL